MVLLTEVPLCSVLYDALVFHIVERPRFLRAIYSLASTCCQWGVCSELTPSQPRCSWFTSTNLIKHFKRCLSPKHPQNEGRQQEMGTRETRASQLSEPCLASWPEGRTEPWNDWLLPWPVICWWEMRWKIVFFYVNLLSSQIASSLNKAVLKIQFLSLLIGNCDRQQWVQHST